MNTYMPLRGLVVVLSERVFSPAGAARNAGLAAAELSRRAHDREQADLAVATAIDAAPRDLAGEAEVRPEPA